MPRIKARTEAARCLDMAGRARRRLILDHYRSAARWEQREDRLSAIAWLREARYWNRVANSLP